MQLTYRGLPYVRLLGNQQEMLISGKGTYRGNECVVPALRPAASEASYALNYRGVEYRNA